MNQKPMRPGSIVTCVNQRDGTVLKLGTASRMIGPTLVDPFHLMLGAGCGDWGICVYLTLADAARLRVELDLVITEQANRG
jgi:hypothetical protein